MPKTATYTLICSAEQHAYELCQQGSSAPPEPPAHCVAPRLSLPVRPASLVARERLLTRLDAHLEGKLTLLSAPAGFGKTTLVSQWMAKCGERPHPPVVAWVSLDAGDN